ncbi:MAG TPA: hypothetical protein VM597_38535 [Gemmataceae bacterium]|nr:hypothetical protein [Gemmataceae bacterium]
MLPVADRPVAEFLFEVHDSRPLVEDHGRALPQQAHQGDDRKPTGSERDAEPGVRDRDHVRAVDQGGATESDEIDADQPAERDRPADEQEPTDAAEGPEEDAVERPRVGDVQGHHE